MGERAGRNAGTRERIIVAATEIFARKGKSGARMEEIAAEARVNKAMVYYYYSTKSVLFQAVLVLIVKAVYDRVFEFLSSNQGSVAGPAETVSRLVNAHVAAFSENVSYAKTLLHALANEPEDLKAALHAFKDQGTTGNSHTPEALLSLVENGITTGEAPGLDPQHTLISIIGMSLIYFIGKPIAEGLLDRKVESDESFLKDRGQNILDLVLHGVAGGQSQARKRPGNGRSPRAPRNR